MAAKIYDATYLLAESFHEVIDEGGNVYNGRAVFNKTINRSYHSKYPIFNLCMYYLFYYENMETHNCMHSYRGCIQLFYL